VTSTTAPTPQVIRMGETWQRPAPTWLAGARANASAAEQTLWRALEEVEDPEYPISVVDMGLIYNIRLKNGTASVDLTFTSMGCPCMEYILDDIRQRLLQEPVVQEVALQIVWEPVWTRKQLTESAIQKLKTWGVSV
jgi:metal-sulfur cluster biosynthetic enzyme